MMAPIPCPTKDLRTMEPSAEQKEFVVLRENLLDVMLKAHYNLLYPDRHTGHGK